jgi:hypothetical protein
MSIGIVGGVTVASDDGVVVGDDPEDSVVEDEISGFAIAVSFVTLVVLFFRDG